VWNGQTNKLRRLALLLLAAGLVTATWAGSPFDNAARAGGTPFCFVAAARDPEHPCRNPRLAYVVKPAPRDAERQSAYPCEPVRIAAPAVCAFGVSGRKATVAVMGDSHALHWRPALARVARHEGWRAWAITRSTCAFSLAPKPGGGQCLGWAHQVVRWLTDHPLVRTVFVSANSGAGVSAAPGESDSASIDGFHRAWRALPPSVREIFVIHDVPHSGKGTRRCVERAIARHRQAGIRCARPRSSALGPDPQAMAAQQAADPRVKLIDLTPFMCDESRCFPVIGGALVIRDFGHLTRTFSSTLGPFLGRAVTRLRAAG
jgi:SGNH domain (fused to AT3 domains)